MRVDAVVIVLFYIPFVICQIDSTLNLYSAVQEVIHCKTIPQTCSTMSDMMDTWRDEILEGIDVVPKTRLHGSLVVFGENAHPILHASNPQDIPLAAAEIGKGRVIVSASKDLITGDYKGTGQIKKSLRKWVSKGEYEDEESDVFVISYRGGDKIPPKTKILMYNGSSSNNRNASMYLEFIENGGGLLYAFQKAPNNLKAGRSHQSLPLSILLHKAGIAYTSRLIRGNPKGYDTESPEGHHNIYYQLQNAKENVDTLTVHSPRLSMTMFRVPSDLLISELSDDLASLYTTYADEFNDALASLKKGKKTPHEKALLTITSLMTDNRIHFEKSPGAAHFPGDFAEMPELECGEVDLEGQYQEMYPTGYYLPAGQELLLRVTSAGDEYEKWAVQIGSHRDRLHGKEKMMRFPVIFVREELTEREMKIYSAHGGLVYFQSGKEPTRIAVRLENIVQAPYYNKLDCRSKKSWKESREAPGLWADIAGENIVFTLPAEVVRDIEDPKEMIDYWDKAVMHQHDLRGTDPRRAKRQWVVADIQPSAGAMHAGYPIVTHLDISNERHKNYVFNMPRLLEHGAWGLFHEIGHNMQRNAWTFDGTREVSNNIFTLYTCEMMSETKAWINPWVNRQLSKSKKYLTTGATFSEWQGAPGIALTIFLQLGHHFGWQSYKKFFREYEAMPGAEHPNNHTAKIEQWISRFSTITGFNLCPMFDFWGFEIDDDVKKALEDLPLCLPDDEIMQLAPHRYRRIVEKYGGKVVTEISGFGDAESESGETENQSDAKKCFRTRGQIPDVKRKRERRSSGASKESDEDADDGDDELEDFDDDDDYGVCEAGFDEDQCAPKE